MNTLDIFDRLTRLSQRGPRGDVYNKAIYRIDEVLRKLERQYICPRCGIDMTHPENIYLNGHDRYGKQTCRCRPCWQNYVNARNNTPEGKVRIRAANQRAGAKRRAAQ